jgi:hypothetical protein
MRIARALLACLLFSACAKSSTSAAPQPEPEGPVRFVDALERVADTDWCAEGSTDQVAFDARTSAGFSADDVLAYAAGTHEERITWEVVQSAEDEAEITVGPESGTQMFSITVEPRGDAARFHVPTRDIVGHGLVCKPWLEIDVHVIVRSEGGALLEGFDATLVSEKGSFAHIAATSESAGLVAQGALFVAHPTVPLASTELRFVFTQYGVTGSVTAYWAEDPYQSEIAHVGKAHCGRNMFALSLDDRIEETSARELAGALGTHDDLPGTWDDGTELKASVSLALTDDTTACGLEVDTGVEQLGFDLFISGDVTLTTEDGRLDETMPGTITVAVGDPMRDGDFSLSGGATWEPASSTPLDLGPVEALERFTAVSLSAGLSRNRLAFSGYITLRGEQPSSCTEPLADGACPDWEPLGYADLRP